MKNQIKNLTPGTEEFVRTQAKGIERMKMYSSAFLYIISKYNPELAEENLINLLISEKILTPVECLTPNVEYTTPFVILLSMSINTQELESRFNYLRTDGKAEFLSMLEFDDILDRYHPDYRYLNTTWGHEVDSRTLGIICRACNAYMKLNPYDLVKVNFFEDDEYDEDELASARQSIRYYDRLKHYRVLKELCYSPLSNKVRTMFNKHKELCAQRDQYDMDVHMKMLNESIDRILPYLQFIQINNEDTIQEHISLLEDRLKETLLSEELIDSMVDIEKERFVVEEPIIIPIMTQTEPQDESLDELDLDIDLDL